jgi:hypothetical protein
MAEMVPIVPEGMTPGLILKNSWKIVLPTILLAYKVTVAEGIATPETWGDRFFRNPIGMTNSRITRRRHRHRQRHRNRFPLQRSDRHNINVKLGAIG